LAGALALGDNRGRTTDHEDVGLTGGDEFHIRNVIIRRLSRADA
jgi:hypothetical protein